MQNNLTNRKKTITLELTESVIEHIGQCFIDAALMEEYATLTAILNSDIAFSELDRATKGDIWWNIIKAYVPVSSSLYMFLFQYEEVKSTFEPKHLFMYVEECMDGVSWEDRIDYILFETMLAIVVEYEEEKEYNVNYISKSLYHVLDRTYPMMNCSLKAWAAAKWLTTRMLAVGADPNYHEQHLGETSFQRAAWSEDIELIQMFLKHEDVSLWPRTPKGRSGYCPLYTMVASEKPEIVQIAATALSSNDKLEFLLSKVDDVSGGFFVVEQLYLECDFDRSYRSLRTFLADDFDEVLSMLVFSEKRPISQLAIDLIKHHDVYKSKEATRIALNSIIPGVKIMSSEDR